MFCHHDLRDGSEQHSAAIAIYGSSSASGLDGSTSGASSFRNPTASSIDAKPVQCTDPVVAGQHTRDTKTGAYAIIDRAYTYDISVLDADCTGKHATIWEWDWLTSACRRSAANASELRHRCRGRTGPGSTPDYTSAVCDHTIGSNKWNPAGCGTRVGASFQWS